MFTQQRRFVSKFGLSASDCPMLELNRTNWRTPFRIARRSAGAPPPAHSLTVCA